MSEEKPAAAPEPGKEPTPAEMALVQPPAKNKLLPIVVGVNTLMMIGVVVVVLMKAGHSEAKATPAKGAEASEGKEEGEPEEEEHEGKGEPKKGSAGPTVKLDDFVVRLRNPESDRFARVSFEIEVASEKDKERLTAAMARVRDGFIGELTERTVEELRGTDGLNAIKVALTHKLKELVPNCKIRGLYVTDFIVQ